MDYVVIFYDVREGEICEQETFTGHSMPSLLRLLSRRVEDDAALVEDCCGMDIRAVDASD